MPCVFFSQTQHAKSDAISHKSISFYSERLNSKKKNMSETPTQKDAELRPVAEPKPPPEPQPQPEPEPKPGPESGPAERIQGAYRQVVSHPGVNLDVVRSGLAVGKRSADVESPDEVGLSEWTVRISKGGIRVRARRAVSGIVERFSRNPMQAVALIMRSTSTAIMVSTLVVYAMFMVSISDDPAFAESSQKYLPEAWGAYGTAIAYTTLVVLGPVLTLFASRGTIDAVSNSILQLDSKCTIELLSETKRSPSSSHPPAVASISIESLDHFRAFQLIASLVSGGVSLIIMTTVSRATGVSLGVLCAVVGRDAIEQLVESSRAVTLAALDVVHFKLIALQDVRNEVRRRSVSGQEEGGADDTLTRDLKKIVALRKMMGTFVHGGLSRDLF